MLDNLITLTVDETNDDALTSDVDYVYSRFDTYNTRSIFHGPQHTPVKRELLSFYRSPAKVNGLFAGTQKSSFKFTTDIEVSGVDGVSTLTVPIIFEVSASIPLGASSAQILLEQQKVEAVLATKVIVSALNEKLSI